MKIVRSISGISFHWKCENPDCSYESQEITIDRGHSNPPPPNQCPKCGRKSEASTLRRFL
jgi:ssDNA-binding Zn-finger/Zn-ribbon topoisomerase 1